jgi:2-polyprenyl-3-methyl-5-hydroxy-6-metoxy-1,4-benzoquinol methylase
MKPNGQYGEEVWERKIKEQGGVGVVRGSNARLKDVEEQLSRYMKIFDKEVIPLIPKKGMILDAGCGPFGRFSIEFAKRGFSLTGLDISRTTLEHAKKNIESTGVKVKLIQEDITRLSKIKDGSTDFIFCIETFFHIPPHLSGIVLYNFNKKLKPKKYCLVQFGVEGNYKKGLALLFYWAGHLIKKAYRKSFRVNVTKFNKKQIIELVDRTGFVVEKVFEDNMYLLRRK